MATAQPYPARPVAVLGATGYTGRLVVAEARAAGLPLRLVGRRRSALEALARAGEEIRVADARDAAALGEALDGALALVSLAGPFVTVGDAPVAAAIAAGAHWIDTTGEQEFSRGVYERFGSRAAERGLVLLTAFGFDYVPGDLAARLAAAEVAGPLDELVVAYSVSNAATSRGTRRTGATLAGRPHLARADGVLVPSAFAATTRRIAFPFGERDVVEWWGTEPLTVPRHTDVRTVRSYVRAPAAVAKAGPLTRLAAPLLRLRARLGPDGPDEAQRRAARFVVVAEARGTAGEGRAVVAGTDMYGLTAKLVVVAAEALARGEVRGAGALAPAEAFDARSLAERVGLEVVVGPAADVRSPA